MSNVNDVVVSLNQLERLINSNQENVNREIESINNVINKIILQSGRRFYLLKRGLRILKTSLSSLDQNQQIINQLVSLTQQDNRHNVSDLPGSIRAILSTITPNKETIDLDSSEIGGNVSTESVKILDEFGTGGHVNGLETNVPSTSSTNDANFSQSKSANEEANFDFLDPALPSVSTAYEHQQTTVFDPTTDEENFSWFNLPSSTIPAMIKASSSPAQSVSQYFDICKRVKTEDGADTVDSDCECDDCIAEIKEFKNRNIAQIQVKKEEVESGDENDIGLEDGDQLNDNQNESLHEQSNGPNQRSMNANNPIGQQVDNGGDEQNESGIEEGNELQVSEQSKTRKRKRPVESLVPESGNLLDNSLPSSEMDTPGPTTRSRSNK